MDGLGAEEIFSSNVGFLIWGERKRDRFYAIFVRQEKKRIEDDFLLGIKIRVARKKSKLFFSFV